MAQTSYSLDPAVGLPGMPADTGYNDIRSYPCSEDIPFGVLCELASGKVRRCQQSGSGLGSTVVGVSVYDPAREQQVPSAGTGAGSYKSGEMVPLLRKGRVFAQWNGTTQTALTQPNVNHPSSSDPSGIRGVFTDASTSTTAGSEITQCPASILMVRDTGSTSLCLVEINLPGA